MCATLLEIEEKGLGRKANEKKKKKTKRIIVEIEFLDVSKSSRTQK